MTGLWRTIKFMNAENAPQPEAWQNIATLEAVARPYYQDLPYHNWQHAKDVLRRSLAYADACEQNDHPVDHDAIAAASLLHDAAYWLRPGIDHELPSKEAYSAWVASDELSKLGMPQEKIELVQQIILSTEKGKPCQSMEASCVRQADLANVASYNPFYFLLNTYRLYVESKQLEASHVVPICFDDFTRFARKSYETLTAYLQHDNSLGEFDVDNQGRNPFHNRAIRNVELLMKPDNLRHAWERLTARHLR